MKTCKSCKFFKTPCECTCSDKSANFTLPEYDCEDCKDFQPIFKNNGDWIRAMNNKELARYLSDGEDCPETENDCVITCTQCWLNWLNSPVENIANKI